MILLTLIKKEVLQFFRNKSDVIIMLVFPVVLIWVMGNALNGLMSADKNIFDNKIIYYRVNNLSSDNKDLQVFYNFIIDFEKSTNVKFIENKNYKKATKDVNNNKAICFVDIFENKIKYFRNEKEECTESKIFRNLYEQYMKKYAFLQSNIKSNPNQMKKIIKTETNIQLKLQGISQKEMDSFTYYTFAELILIILYISTLTSVSMYNEKFLHTMTRLKLSNIKKINIVLSKIALGIIVGLMQIGVVYIVSNKFFNVNWTTNLSYILMVLISLIIFSSVLGIFISVIFSDSKTSYTFNNMIIIIMGFLGGSYVPICLIKSVKVTSFISEIMPTYWANISILALNYNVKSSAYITSILICLISSFIMLILSYLISKLKAGGNFD